MIFFMNIDVKKKATLSTRLEVLGGVRGLFLGLTDGRISPFGIPFTDPSNRGPKLKFGNFSTEMAL